MSHQADEFNAFFAAAVANQVNEALAQWQAGVNTFARTALQARREYIRFMRDLHLDGLDGAAVPVVEYLAADITHLYFRKAAPSKGRPEQYRIRLLSGETLDISAELGEQIASDGRRHYNGRVTMSDDKPGCARWVRWQLDGNDFGLLVENAHALV